MARRTQDVFIEQKAAHILWVWADDERLTKEYGDMLISEIDGVVGHNNGWTGSWPAKSYGSVLIDPRYDVEELKTEITTLLSGARAAEDD